MEEEKLNLSKTSYNTFEANVTKKPSIRKRFQDIRNQLVVVLIANISSISIGFEIGWVAPIIAKFRSSDSPLETGSITTIDQTWIGCSTVLGIFIGPFLFAFISNRFGKKIGIIFIPVPIIFGTLFIIFKKTLTFFIIYRITVGLSAGGTFILIPLLVTEISDDHVRGMFGSILNIFKYFGLFLGTIIGSYVPFQISALFLLLFPILLISTFSFVPESPLYLYSINEEEKANKSLIFYKNCDNGSKKFEFEKAKIDLMLKKLDARRTTRITKNDFNNKSTLKGLLIGLTITTLSICTGVIILSIYATIIFSDSGSTLDPNESTMIMALIQLIGSIFAAILCDRIGRKILLIWSLLGCVIGQFTTGLFVYLGLKGHDISNWSWTVVAGMSLILFASSIGIAPLRHVITLEVVPPKLRPMTTILNNVILCISQFLFFIVFPIVSETYGLHTMMWILCVGCALGVLFVILIVDETMCTNVNT